MRERDGIARLRLVLGFGFLYFFLVFFHCLFISTIILMYSLGFANIGGKLLFGIAGKVGVAVDGGL